jgi:predicted amidophosphoribosyltransferase
MPNRQPDCSAIHPVCPCCGGWGLPGRRTCAGCEFHIAHCHEHRVGLARLEARFDDLDGATYRFGLVNYGGRAA